MALRGAAALAVLTTAVLTAAACDDPAPPMRPPGPEVTPQPEPPADAPLASLVDPFVGSANEGQTFPGAMVPWGMASPSPHTNASDAVEFLAGARANGGYIDGEPQIHGFGQTHLSGVGCPDLGGPVVVPTVGEVLPRFDFYGSAYENERAYAGYYAVDLTDIDAHVELTATERVGVTRIFFDDRDGDANVLIDVGRTLSWLPPDGRVRVVSASEVEGHVLHGGFCTNPQRTTVYFVARFDQDAVETGTWGTEVGPGEAEGRAGAFLRFRSWRGHPVTVRVGLSYTSVEGARANLDAEAEAPFEELRDAAVRRWQDELSRVEVEGTERDRARFYTALYHSLIHPNVMHDVGAEERYTVFSLWDTYRTVHPLLTLLYPERQAAMMRSIATLTTELGGPPKWELLGNEVQMMVGDPALIVAAHSLDAGITGFDEEALYVAMRDAAERRGADAHRPANDDYLDLGFVPMERAEEAWGPVSTSLEYALADAALARMASALGHDADVAALAARASSWEVFYDADAGLLRPLMADGSAYAPFDPDATEGSARQRGAGGPGYVEGSAWAYAFFVPHDTARLIELHGGDAAFTDDLAWVFETDRYEMWNEPDLAYPYLFDHVPGQEHRTQSLVREALETHFDTGPAGLPGNDDTGTLSAWFVFSALGLYPDDPTLARYALGSPLFTRAVLTIDGGTFIIEAPGNDASTPYVSSRMLDGAPLDAHFLDRAAIRGGATLRLSMTDARP